VIDLHCHVLPGIDDGPETLDESIELARAASLQGTSVLVATPHVTYDHLHNTSDRILSAVEKLNRALRKQRIDLMVLPGAEVALERAGELDDDELAALRLGGGPWLLVECPMFAGGMGVDGQLHALASRGHRIVLAHPERCPVFQTDLDRLERLVEAGMLGQVTASALTGQFGRTVERIARDMVDRDLIHIAASDAHNAGRRPPVIRDHLEDAGLDDMADWLASDVPEAVLAGTSVPYRPRVERAPQRKGLFGRRGRR
jgi:protein-tyrosine phosphatase